MPTTLSWFILALRPHNQHHNRKNANNTNAAETSMDGNIVHVGAGAAASKAMSRKKLVEMDAFSVNLNSHEEMMRAHRREEAGLLDQVMQAQKASVDAVADGNHEEAVLWQAQLKADLYALADLNFARLVEKVGRFNVVAGAAGLAALVAFILSLTQTCDTGYCLTLFLVQSALVGAHLYMLKVPPRDSMPEFQPKPKPVVTIRAKPVVHKPHMTYDEVHWKPSRDGPEVILRNPPGKDEHLVVNGTRMSMAAAWGLFAKYCDVLKKNDRLKGTAPGLPDRIVARREEYAALRDKYFREVEEADREYLVYLRGRIAEQQRLTAEYASYYHQYQRTFAEETTRQKNKNIAAQKRRLWFFKCTTGAMILAIAVGIISAAVCGSLAFCSLHGAVGVFVSVRFYYFSNEERHRETIRVTRVRVEIDGTPPEAKADDGKQKLPDRQSPAAAAPPTEVVRDNAAEEDRKEPNDNSSDTDHDDAAGAGGPAHEPDHQPLAGAAVQTSSASEIRLRVRPPGEQPDHS